MINRLPIVYSRFPWTYKKFKVDNLNNIIDYNNSLMMMIIKAITFGQSLSWNTICIKYQCFSSYMSTNFVFITNYRAKINIFSHVSQTLKRRKRSMYHFVYSVRFSHEYRCCRFTLTVENVFLNSKDCSLRNPIVWPCSIVSARHSCYAIVRGLWVWRCGRCLLLHTSL